MDVTQSSLSGAAGWGGGARRRRVTEGLRRRKPPLARRCPSTTLRVVPLPVPGRNRDPLAFHFGASVCSTSVATRSSTCLPSISAAGDSSRRWRKVETASALTSSGST